MTGEEEGNSKRANLRLDHMETTLVEIKKLAEKRNVMQHQEGKERNLLYVRLCEDVASLKTEVRIVGAIALSIATALVVNYFTG